MTDPANWHIYQWLAEWVHNAKACRWPSFQHDTELQNIVSQFNDEKVLVEVPPDFYDMDDTYGIDPNDVQSMYHEIL